MSVLFEDAVAAIFAKAGVAKAGNEELWEEANALLHQQMGQLSVASAMGSGVDRVKLFNEQKQALVDDLLELKAKGEIK